MMDNTLHIVPYTKAHGQIYIILSNESQSIRSR